jgi:hypothetical protein
MSRCREEHQNSSSVRLLGKFPPSCCQLVDASYSWSSSCLLYETDLMSFLFLLLPFSKLYWKLPGGRCNVRANVKVCQQMVVVSMRNRRTSRPRPLPTSHRTTVPTIRCVSRDSIPSADSTNISNLHFETRYSHQLLAAFTSLQQAVSHQNHVAFAKIGRIPTYELPLIYCSSK